ncbi:MAG: transketolase, partial [Proteobacteria bacterium]|nr:transketolase [Pseudomonadota bacterium]
GWEVMHVDGHDHSQLRLCLDACQKARHKPLLIIGRSTMAKGAYSLEGSEKTHGSPLPAEERLRTKEALGLPQDQAFYAPEDFYSNFRQFFEDKRQLVKALKLRFATRSKDAEFKKLYQSYYETHAYQNLPEIQWPRDKEVATRNAFGEVLVKWAEVLPNLMGGSADLDPSNMTEAFVKRVGDFHWNKASNRNIAFGVREFPMSAICNGLALHGGMIPFDATFLSFADYSRPALRLGAIQRVRVIHEFTHDSFHLGEDGPTHQPVEHLMSLRLIPNFYVMRPADAFETQIMMEVALNLSRAPSAICLSRQKLPILPISSQTLAQARFGAYAVAEHENPELVIFASGAEVSLALDAAKLLTGIRLKIVSMPCWELFDEQPKSYRDKVLSLNCRNRVSIEAGSTLGWQKFTGSDGLNIGIDHYGDSAPAEDLVREYGFTAEKLTARIKSYLARDL